MICTMRTVAAYQYTSVTSEKEWIRARKALEYLDLAENATLFNWYKKDFQSTDNEDFQIPWIPTSGKVSPVDDCRVLRDWFNSDRRSMFFHLCMKTREPDIIGRNVFLEYVIKKLASDDRYLETGENAIRFLNIATLCGFNVWKESEIDEECCISDYVFSRIYPSIVMGLYKIREEHPLMARKLLDMFYINSKNLFMLFERIPDAQHLQFVLDVAIKSGFDVWSVATFMFSFSYLSVIVAYVIQKRYDLVMTLLRFGLQLEEEPIYWLQSIYMGLWNSRCDFTPTREFKEMLELLFMVHPYAYPGPGVIQESLRNFYQEYRAMGNMDATKGREILYELLNVYENCELGFS